MIVGLAFVVGVVLGGLVVCYLMARAEGDNRRPGYLSTYSTSQESLYTYPRSDD